MSAYDTSPTESLWEVHNGGSSRENNAFFNIFRMKADVLKESYIGFSLTDKEIDGSFNRVAGIDGQFKLKKKLFFSFQAMASKSRFGEEISDISPAFYGDIGYYTKHLGGGLNWTSISFSLRTIIDYNHFDKEIYGSFLVSYILKPGTVFFLGIDNNLSQNNLGKYNRDDYSVFLKFSYWHRI